MTDLQIKAAVRARDGYRCTLCGMTNEEHVAKYGKALDVHRKTPGSTYAVDDSCQTVCRSCHGPLLKSPVGSLLPNGKLPLSLTIPRDLREKMLSAAKAHNRSLPGECIQALQEYAARLLRP